VLRSASDAFKASGNERVDAPKWGDKSTRNLRNVWSMALASLPRRAFCHFPARASRSLHQGGYERVRVLLGMWGAVGADG
jgi:hypothetical protein